MAAVWKNMWDEQKRKAHWDKHFEAYKEYVKKTGQQPPWKFTRHKGVSIGKWLYQEIIPNRNYLSDERIKVLKELGFDFNLNQISETVRTSKIGIPRQSLHQTKNTQSPGTVYLKTSNTPSREEFQIDYKTMSLADMASKYHFTRQYIHKLLKLHGIPRRSRQEARQQAIAQEKLFSTRVNELGEYVKTYHINRYANEDFFKTWSPAMAYALGILYSDGCILPSRDREERIIHKNRSPVCTISVSQKEPELLEKLTALLESNALINFQAKRGIAGAVYGFKIRSNKMYEDLLNLGLSPRKSRTIAFPSIPQEYARHFLRGCWDGDGSIYIEDKNPLKSRAHYVSGSKVFIEKLAHQLSELGLTNATVHTAKNGQSFYVKYGPKDCVKLFHLFYDGVDESMFLNRKYDRFKSASDIIVKSTQLQFPFPMDGNNSLLSSKNQEK